MAEKELKIKINVDAKTGNLKVVSGEFEKLESSGKKANTGIADLKKTLLGLGAAVGGIALIKKAFDEVVVAGVNYNRTMENQVAGIRALAVATSSNVDSMGNVLSIQEKYTLAQKEALSTMKELEAVNALTPHTLEQTSQIYKSLYANAKQYGASQKEMVEMTKLVSIAAGNAGIQFQQVLASVDGLANGTFLANSEMGRFLTSIGLAPAKLRALAAEGKSTEEILRVLRDFDFDAGTFDQSLSNLENSWNNFTGTITNNIYQEMKPAMNDLADWLDELTQSFKDTDIESQRIFEVKGRDNQIIKVTQLEEELREIENDLSNESLFDDFFDDNDKVLEQRKKKILLDLRLLGNELSKETKEVAKLVGMNVDTGGLTKIMIGNDASIEKSFNTLEKNYKELTKTYSKDSKALAKIDADYYKTKNKLIQNATKVHTKELTTQKREAERLQKEQQRAYKQFLRDKAKANADFNKEYDKAFLDSFALMEKETDSWYTNALAKHEKYGIDKIKIDELYNQKLEQINDKHTDQAYKDQIKYYADLNKNTLKLELKKEKEILDISKDYSKEDRDHKISIIEDKYREEIRLAKAAAGDLEAIWDGVGINMADSISNAFDNVIINGASLSGSLGDMFTNLTQNATAPFTTTLSAGLSDAFGGFIGANNEGLTGDGILGNLTSFMGGEISSEALLENLTSEYNNFFNNSAAGIDNALFGAGLGDFDTAFAEMFNVSIGAMMASAGQGAAIGGFGDSLFGTDTDADLGGALGGALASMTTAINPLVGAAIGAILGSFSADWEYDSSGVSISGNIKEKIGELDEVMSEYDKFKKKTWFTSSTKFEFRDLTDEMTLYMEDAIRGVEKIEELFNAVVDLDFDNYTGDLDTALSDRIIAGISKLDDVFEKPNIQDYDIYGEESDWVKKLSEYSADVDKWKQATSDATSDTAVFNEIRNSWTEYAEKAGMTVTEALIQGAERMSSLINNMDQLKEDIFDLDGFENQLDKVKESFGDFSSLLEPLNLELGDITVANFSEKFEEAMQGTGFNNLDLTRWEMLGESLEEAARGADALKSSLEGMIVKYDTAIQSFDKMIADFRGIELEKAQVEDSMTLDAIAKLTDAVLTEDNQNKQLEAAQLFQDGLAKLNTDMDARFESWIGGQRDNEDALITEIENTLTFGLGKITEDIGRINEELKTVTEAGDTEAIAALNEQIGLLQTEQDTLQGLADGLKTDGLSEEIVTGMTAANDIVFAQMAEDVKAGLETEKANLETLLQEQNAILTSIEGILANPKEDVTFQNMLDTLPADISTSLTTAMEPMNTAIGTIDTSSKETRDAMVALPETIGTGFTTAIAPLSTDLQGLGASLTLLPESFNSSLEPVNNTMIEMSAAVGMLPETFTVAMLPVTASMDTVSASMLTIAPEITTGVEAAFAPVGTAMDANTGAVRQLQEMEARTASAAEGTTAAVNASSDRIAAAVANAVSRAISGMQSQVNAAVDAANRASDAAVLSNSQIATMNAKIGSIEANTRQTVVQTAVVAENTGA